MQLRETQFQFEWEGMLFQTKSHIQGQVLCTGTTHYESGI